MPIRQPFDFSSYLDRLDLQPHGAPIATRCSDLLPVLWAGQPAMLKVAHEDEERLGHILLRHWNGDGAARLLAHDGDAIVLERLRGTQSLVGMVQTGQDDAATRIICSVAARLHAPRPADCPGLLPLATWFVALQPGAARYGGVLIAAHEAAQNLLATPRDVTTLHGDLHHENVLDTGDARGFLAIDPKRLIGDRGFDFANIVCNPERDLEIVRAPGRLLRQARIIADVTGYEHRRLLRWILAYAGLSAAWILDDGDTPHLEFAVAEIVAAELEA